MAPSGFTIHATKKLLDRVKHSVVSPVEPVSVLGNFYATAIFWKPQVALLVNETTTLPVLLPLAPAATLADRFPGALRHVLDAHWIDRRFVDSEIAAMGAGSYAKTASRSMLGVLNEYAYLGGHHYHEAPGPERLVATSLCLAGTPLGPLRSRHGSADRELKALTTTRSTPTPATDRSETRSTSTSDRRR